jgi:hypothetical protein
MYERWDNFFDAAKVKKISGERSKFQSVIEVGDLFAYRPAMKGGLPKVDLMILPMDEVGNDRMTEPFSHEFPSANRQGQCPPGIEDARDVEQELHGTKCLVKRIRCLPSAHHQVGSSTLTDWIMQAVGGATTAAPKVVYVDSVRLQH